MSVAIRTAVRIQDQDDAPSLGAGQDGYALTWDNGTGAFVATALSAGVTDHGALTGLTDDDHTGYALLAGRSGGQVLYGGTDANDDITIHGTSNATRTTSYVILQPTAGNVGIGTSAPASLLQVTGTTFLNGTLDVGDTAYRDTTVAMSIKSNRTWLFNMYDGSTVAKLGLSQTGLFMIGPLNGASRLSVYGGASIGTSYYTTAAPTDGAIIDGSVGIGTVAPVTKLHVSSVTAGTNAIRNVLTLDATVIGAGVGAAGLGAAVLFTLETSTTPDTNAASVQAVIYEATHATRKFDLVGTAYDAGGEREGWRVRGNGSAAAIGFLGATPQARIAHVADPAGGGTVDAEARTAINSILSTLELFGFHSAS